MWDGGQVPLISFLLPISLFDYFLKQKRKQQLSLHLSNDTSGLKTVLYPQFTMNQTDSLISPDLLLNPFIVSA